MAKDSKIMWTAEEDAHLIALRAAGYSNQKIADSVGRPRSTVGKRLVSLLGKNGQTEEIPAQTRQMPHGEPPDFPPEKRSDIRRRWTPEEDEQIVTLRVRGLSLTAIGDLIGRGPTSVCVRLQRLSETRITRPPIKIGDDNRGGDRVGRADFFRRPDGPAPRHPDVLPDPNAPAWRKCLGDGCGKIFWSPSGGVRRCPSCKKMLSKPECHGSGMAMADTSECRVWL